MPKKSKLKRVGFKPGRRHSDKILGIQREVLQGPISELKKIKLTPPFERVSEKEVKASGRRHFKNEKPSDRRSENWDDYGQDNRKRKTDRRKS